MMRSWQPEEQRVTRSVLCLLSGCEDTFGMGRTPSDGSRMFAGRILSKLLAKLSAAWMSGLDLGSLSNSGEFVTCL